MGQKTAMTELTAAKADRPPEPTYLRSRMFTMMQRNISTNRDMAPGYPLFAIVREFLPLNALTENFIPDLPDI